MLALALSLCASAAAVLTATAPAAGAATDPKAHDPVASTPTITATSTGLHVTGWAFDPDAKTSNAKVFTVTDGRTASAKVSTSLPGPTVRKQYGLGPTPRYALDVAVPTGKHVVCVVVANTGAGLDTVRRCVATPWGRALTSAQTAARSPKGAMTAGWANKASVHFQGWASDPDDVDRGSLVVLYVDGAPAKTVATTAYPAPRPAAAGARSKFDVLVPVAVRGTHVGCLWVVNSGLGSNAFLGCKTVDNRNAGLGLPAYTAPPRTNTSIATLATQQIGKPYVWGATGPKSFDCSGLVQWAYKKYGITTPRISEDQVTAARWIPASHARAGDLVFYHDSVGDVYHVGIFLKPGLSVAAIDEAEGVDHQTIWDTTATYGSFTHT